jgi:hypothetical protein
MRLKSRMRQKTDEKVDAGIDGISKLDTAPMPARLALMFRTMAGKLSSITNHMTGFG